MGSYTLPFLLPIAAVEVVAVTARPINRYPVNIAPLFSRHVYHLYSRSSSWLFLVQKSRASSDRESAISLTPETTSASGYLPFLAGDSIESCKGPCAACRSVLVGSDELMGGHGHWGRMAKPPTVCVSVDVCLTPPAATSPSSASSSASGGNASEIASVIDDAHSKSRKETCMKSNASTHFTGPSSGLQLLGIQGDDIDDEEAAADEDDDDEDEDHDDDDDDDDDDDNDEGGMVDGYR
jgi:hypothetical protein